MQWYWIVVIAAGAAIAAYLTLCIVIAMRVLKTAVTPVAHTLDEARVTQAKNENMDFADYDSEWNKQNFEVNGVHGKIRGEVVFNGNAPYSKVAVICHGHTWNRINSIKYAREFYRLGYSLVLYDHAYFGQSEGDFTTLGLYEKQDLNSVLTYVRGVFGKDAIVGLHGESMGAATVLLELGVRDDVDFVVADCPFSDTMKYYRELCTDLAHLPSFPIVDVANAVSKRKYGYDFNKVKPIDAVAGSAVPVCFIHGAADTFIRPHHSEDMYKVSASPLSELHLVAGAGHACSFKTDNAGYRKIVENFVVKVEDNLTQLKKVS